jgi:hypothetical protein
VSKPVTPSRSRAHPQHPALSLQVAVRLLHHEVAHAVDDGPAAVLLDVLGDVRMAADDRVVVRLEAAGREFAVAEDRDVQARALHDPGRAGLGESHAAAGLAQPVLLQQAQCV